MSAPKAALPTNRTILDGTYCRLEPLTSAHADDLFEAIKGSQNETRHQYLFETPPKSSKELEEWINSIKNNPELLYSAVINKQTGRCGGRQALMRIQPEHGVIEVGSILWGQGIAKTALATEAFYLTAKYVFEDLGYRRFEWKCNNLNKPSKRAAIRLGYTFEGIFRQHMIIKGQSRDTAWFSMLDNEWPTLKRIYLDWLSPENFDQDGVAKSSLATPRQP